MSIFRGVQQGDIYSATENLPAMQQNINNMMMRAAEAQANAYASIGKSIGGALEQGIAEYAKNRDENEYVSQTLQDKSAEALQWKQILESDPKFAPLARSLDEYLGKAVKGPSMSLNQKKALDASLGAVLQKIPSQVQMMQVIGERQDKFNALDAERQGMVTTLDTLISSFAGDPSKADIAKEYGTVRQRLIDAKDINGLSSAIMGSRNAIQMLPELKAGAATRATQAATRSASELAATTPAFGRRGDTMVTLPQSPLTVKKDNKTLDMTPSEFLLNRRQQLIDAGVPAESINDQLSKDLAGARDAIASAKGLNPAVQQAWLSDFESAQSNFSADTYPINPDNNSRATERVGKQVEETVASMQEPPAIRTQRRVSEKFTSNEHFVSQETSANTRRQEEGKEPRRQVQMPDGRTGFEVVTLGPDGKKVNLGAVGSYKEELEVLQKHRLANLPKYVAAVDREARARGYSPNSEQYNNFVKSAKEDIRVSVLEGMYPPTIKDADGKDIENPQYAEAAAVYDKLFGGQGIDLTASELGTAANLFAVASYVSGGVAASDVAVQQLTQRNPWGVIEAMSGGRIKGPEQFAKWVEAEKAKGVLAFNQKVQGIVDGRVKSLVDDAEQTYLGGKKLLWSWKDNKYSDPTNTVKPEVLEAASEYRRVNDQKYTEMYQVWKQNNPNKVPTKLDHASFAIAADKAAREAVDKKARTGAFGGVSSKGIEKELLNAEEINILKRDHPAIAAEVTDGNGNIDIDAAKKRLGAKAAELEKKAEQIAIESLSPEAKAARIALENRDKIVRRIGGTGWKGLVKRVGFTAAVTFGGAAYAHNGPAKTPEYKAFSHAFGEDGVVDKRIRELSVAQSESKRAGTDLQTMQRNAALATMRPAGAAQAGTTPTVPTAPVLPSRKTEVPNYTQISRQERVNSIASQLQARHGITFGEASALASTFIPEQSGPQVRTINGVPFYSGDGKDWKPVPAESVKLAGGAGGPSFNETFFGTRVVNPETGAIEIKPQAYTGFAILGKQPEDPVDRRKLRNEFISASAAKRAIAGIRKEIAENPNRGGPLNIGGSNTAIRQKYVLGLFKAALEQSGQDSRPSDLDVKNIMDSLARASDLFTTDKTALRALQDFENDLDARLRDVAMQNGVQISIDGGGGGLQQLEEQARTEQFMPPR